MTPLNVLVGCERSGKVRDAFRRRGHKAWSCDLAGVEPGGQFPEFHLSGDVRSFFKLAPNGQPWDLGIFFPDCTFLCAAGIKHLFIGYKKANGFEPERWRKMEEGAAFFLECLNAPIPHVAAENSRPHVHALELIGRPNQIIQPHEFGHGEKKATCLWLRKLPPLFATLFDQGRSDRVHKMGQTEGRAMARAETFDGVAEAMADQWGAFVEREIGRRAA